MGKLGRLTCRPNLHRGAHMMDLASRTTQGFTPILSRVGASAKSAAVCPRPQACAGKSRERAGRRTGPACQPANVTRRAKSHHWRHIPSLVIDGVPHGEAAALALLLTERHPQAGLAPAPGNAQRAELLQ